MGFTRTTAAKWKTDMTDEELVKALRTLGRDFDDWDTAADRIEALNKERDEAINQLDSARYSVDVLEKRVAFVEKERKKTFQALLKTTKIHDEAEAKLAKAVEALGRAKASIENGGGGGVIDVVWLDDPCPETLCDFIDATLAEIKGGNDAESNL